MPRANHQIAIDGPAASGKSTVAQGVARRLDAVYIDTGAMYRTLTRETMRRRPQAAPADAVVDLLDDVDIRYAARDGDLVLTLDGEPVDARSIRTAEVTARVSEIAAVPDVRRWMVERQRESAELGLVVMEGRDIGTVVFPAARWKFFLTATAHERARRRLAQDDGSVDNATLESVAADIARRDRLDSTRATAPLRPADDAVQIDTTGMGIDEVVTAICRQVEGAP